MPRPRGLAKSGGRQTGTPNKNTAILKDIAQPYTAAAISTLVRIMNSEKYPAQARVAAAGMLMDRAWGRPMQQIEAHNINEQHYAIAPQKMSDPEWRQFLEFKQSQAVVGIADRKAKLVEAPPNPAQPNGKSAPKLN